MRRQGRTFWLVCMVSALIGCSSSATPDDATGSHEGDATSEGRASDRAAGDVAPGSDDPRELADVAEGEGVERGDATGADDPHDATPPHDTTPDETPDATEDVEETEAVEDGDAADTAEGPEVNDTQAPSEPETDSETSEEDVEAPACEEGTLKEGVTPCGPQGEGLLEQLCSDGVWVDTESCLGATEAAPTHRLGEGSCGPEGEGTPVEVKQGEAWIPTSICMMSADRSYDPINLFAGYFSSEWDYSQAAFPASGMYGWSYYLRAFDLIRDTPVHELGWGQWSKPNMPADGLEVCGIHPHGFVCDEEAPSAEAMAGELEGCGDTEYENLEACAVWCCGEEDKCGVRGSIEGGMGYWMYTLETPQVKWMLPGATNANYEIFGGTFLNDRQQPCITLGGAVRIANNFVIPNDFVSFEDDNVNGFLGYMLTRTPIGKRADTDDANYWTIIIDAENFAGPVMYMSSWFWDSRINWHPKSVSWSDPRALIGYVAEGFEGRIGGIQVLDAEGNTWRRTNRWALPKDVIDGQTSETSTLFTGHAQYNTDWAAEAMEPMLSGTGDAASQSPQAIRDKALSLGVAPGGGCRLPNSDTDEGQLRLQIDDENGEVIWKGFGVGVADDGPEAQNATDQAQCHTRLTLDPETLDCTSTEGWCEGHRYIKLNADGSTPTVVSEADVPADIKAALALREFKETRKNTGEFLGPPAESEAPCFDMPGPAPADPRLYCTRTKSGNWLGFRWYRFVDQPELNQVFASLPEDEKEAAKCYMQARIERLHAAQQSGDELPRWFDAPQGADALPGAKVAIDTALLVTPPPGLELGFVPIPVYERKRTKPAECEVIVGSYEDEPNPLPDDYYDGFPTHPGGYDIEWCPANSESGDAFNYPGTIFGYAPGGDQSERIPYHIPTRDAVASVLSAAPTSCGLASDPPPNEAP